MAEELLRERAKDDHGDEKNRLWLPCYLEMDARIVTGDPDFKKTIRLAAVDWV